MSKADQLQWDLEDAAARLQAMRRAISRKDEAEQTVRLCQARLAEARRKLREATWDLTVALGEERRKGGGTV